MGPTRNIVATLRRSTTSVSLLRRLERDNSLSGATVYDPNYASYVGNLKSRHVERYFARTSIVPDFMLQPREKGAPVRQYGSFLVDLSKRCIYQQRGRTKSRLEVAWKLCAYPTGFLRSLASVVRA